VQSVQQVSQLSSRCRQESKFWAQPQLADVGSPCTPELCCEGVPQRQCEAQHGRAAAQSLYYKLHKGAGSCRHCIGSPQHCQLNASCMWGRSFGAPHHVQAAHDGCLQQLSSQGCSGEAPTAASSEAAAHPPPTAQDGSTPMCDRHVCVTPAAVCV
jgi:hypothetical protein